MDGKSHSLMNWTHRDCWSLCTLIIGGLIASVIHADDSSINVLKAVRDAQKGHVNRHPRGILDARCSEENQVNKERNVAEVHLEWQGDSAFWRYTYHQFDLDSGEAKYSSRVNDEFLKTPKNTYSYRPELHYFSVSPTGRFSLPDRILDVRPHPVWYEILPTLGGKTWHDLIGDVLDRNEEVRLETKPNGIVHWTAETAEAGRSLVVFDLNQGANVVLFELDPPPGRGNDHFRCESTWADDQAGGYRLGKCVVKRFKDSIESPEQIVQLEVLDFNGQPKFEKQRFSRASFKLPSGTRVETFDAAPGSHPKVSHIGRAPSNRLSIKTLQDLSQQLKEDGFADPARQKSGP